MEALRIVINIIFILVCVALTVLVLMQEGKNNGLGALTGSSDTYWSKNKGKSKESVLKKVTVVLGVLYFALALVLSSKFI